MRMRLRPTLTSARRAVDGRMHACFSYLSPMVTSPTAPHPLIQASINRAYGAPFGPRRLVSARRTVHLDLLPRLLHFRYRHRRRVGPISQSAPPLSDSPSVREPLHPHRLIRMDDPTNTLLGRVRGYGPDCAELRRGRAEIAKCAPSDRPQYECPPSSYAQNSQ